jgi:hypothetical protein
MLVLYKIIKMDFMPNRQRVMRLLFCSFFSLYAISPLIYSYHEQGMHVRPNNSQISCSSIDCFHILLVDLIIDACSRQQEDPQDHPVETIVMIKKRVLPPETVNGKLRLTSRPHFECDLNTFLLRPSSFSREPIMSRRLIRCGFFPLLSGHSPPPTFLPFS